jgi:thioredoxin
MSLAKEVSLSSFELEVIESTMPVIVDFYADWCAPCRMLSPILDQVSKEYAGHVKIVKVNVDAEPGLASQFNVTSIPTLAFVVNGEVVGQSSGIPSKSALKSVLDQMTSIRS